MSEAKKRPKEQPEDDWLARYGEKHRAKKINVPGSEDGRVGDVTIYERNGNYVLRWREDGKAMSETILAAEHKKLMRAAYSRAHEIDERISKKRQRRPSVATTIRDACEAFLKECEASDSCKGSTIKKYRQELARVIEFAESTEAGQRCKHLGGIDTEWCRELCSWLNNVKTTRNGGPKTERNPVRFLTDRQKQGIRQRFASVIDLAITCVPSLVPEDFLNPMSKKMIGKQEKTHHDVGDPPVTIEQLIRIVEVLDEYALAVLAPLFLYGPRPSELGHILSADFDAVTSLMTMKGRKQTGYETKKGVSKTWPLRRVMYECISPLLGRDNGPIFVKRWVFDGQKLPLLAGADETRLTSEYEKRRLQLANELERPLSKEELEKISKGVWTDAGAVTSKDTLRELKLAAKKAGMDSYPTAKDVRHLFESLCEAARLSAGVIRHLMGQKLQRGDSLHNYNHTWSEVLFEQVAALDEYRRPLIDALLTRAAELRDRSD